MIGPVSFTLNGKSTRLTADDERVLLWVLRDDLGLTGTKFGCGAGLCGACTVLLDGEAVRSCGTPLKEVTGRNVVTIEGLAPEGGLHPLQKAFLEKQAFQCGYCTSGMILTASALLRKSPGASREEIVRQMDANLCRCGSYKRILDAIEAARPSGGAK